MRRGYDDPFRDCAILAMMKERYADGGEEILGPNIYSDLLRELGSDRFVMPVDA